MHMMGAFSLFAGWLRWQSFQRKIYCCLTVDLDGHGHKNAFEEGCPFLLDFFAEKGLHGAITWFYNCREKELSKYPSFLLEIKKREDEVGLHSHLEDLLPSMKISQMRNRILKEKSHLECFLGYGVKGFRSGRFLRNDQLFQVLGASGFLYDSSFTYGRRFHVKGHQMDDSKIRGNQSAFRLVNGMLEFPVWEPFPRPREISLKGPPYFITNLIHPYNLVWKGKGNYIIQRYYRSIVETLLNIPGVEFINLSKACQIWEQKI